MRQFTIILVFALLSFQISGQTKSKINGKYYSAPLTSNADPRCKLSINKDLTFELEYEDDSQGIINKGTWVLKSDTLFLKVTEAKHTNESAYPPDTSVVFVIEKDHLCPFPYEKTHWCCVSKKNKKW